MRILQQKILILKSKPRSNNQDSISQTLQLAKELERNQNIKNNIQDSIERSRSQRVTLGSVLRKIFDTVQDKICQLSTQLTQLTECLEGKTK